MATFLTTPRMNPALRARVERAVSHKERAKHHAAKVGLNSPFADRSPLRLARLLPLVALFLVVGLGSATYMHEHRVMEADRTALLATLEERRAGLPEGHEAFLAELAPWIAETAADLPPAALLDPALREPGALDAWLGRPAVYVRAPAIDLRTAGTRDGAVSGSIKDAFLYCLSGPPASTAPSDLLAKVRGVYFGGSMVDEQTANVRRLAEANAGLHVLGPAFEAAVRAAEVPAALQKMRRELEGAPTGEAKRAAAAELLIVVADEDEKAGARAARVALVDLGSARPLLRARLSVPPVGSAPGAVLHRADIEGCGLAAAVRAAVDD
jgi:hypothetical protein